MTIISSQSAGTMLRDQSLSIAIRSRSLSKICELIGETVSVCRLRTNSFPVCISIHYVFQWTENFRYGLVRAVSLIPFFKLRDWRCNPLAARKQNVLYNKDCWISVKTKWFVCFMAAVYLYQPSKYFLPLECMVDSTYSCKYIHTLEHLAMTLSV